MVALHSNGNIEDEDEMSTDDFVEYLIYTVSHKNEAQELILN